MRNQVTLIGNMGENPSVTNFDNGSKVARFNMATENFVNGKNTAEWHKVFAWGNVAQFIENFGSKGKKIVITGKLVNRTFIGKLGKPQKITEVEVQHVIGL